MRKKIRRLIRLISPFILLTLTVALIGGCGGGEVNDTGIIEKTFPNGFKLVLKENHASQMITSIVLVNAGSKYESDSTNGFTHFLEHLNFDGTATKSRIDINEGVKNHGGYINAFTNKDATTYLILMPSEYIDFGLDVQSDQLFGSVFPQDEYEKERKVVTEEIRKDYDDISYRVEMFNDSIVYAGTPYQRTVLGSPGTIAKVSRQAVINYYKSQYTPENMLAIAIGDFNADSMIALYDKYFGNRPKGGKGMEVHFSYKFPASDSVYYRKTDTKTNFINITYPAPLYTEKDYYAFDMLARYLNADEASPLYIALTKGDKPLIQSLSVNLDTKKEFTNLVVSVMTNDAKNTDEIIKRTNEVFKNIIEEGIEKEDLDRFIVKAKVGEYLLEERLHYWGIMKAELLAVGGFDFVNNYIDNLSKVTPDDLQSAVQKYFSNIKYVATAVVSKS